MRRMLDLRPGERVLDLGCGAGKFALYAGGDGRAAPPASTWRPSSCRAAARDGRPGGGRPAPAAVPQGQLPARLLPRRARAPRRGRACARCCSRRGACSGRAGRLFVYTHAMESSRLASFQRGVNRLAKRLGRVGLIDHEREAMRKSDHVNAIRSHEHFDAALRAGRAAGRGAALLQRGRQGGGRGPGCCGWSSSGGAAARAGTTPARDARPTPEPARARGQPGRRAASALAVAHGAHLGAQARRRALRRHPHRAVLRPAARRRLGGPASRSAT